MKANGILGHEKWDSKKTRFKPGVNIASLLEKAGLKQNPMTKQERVMKRKLEKEIKWEEMKYSRKPD